MTGCWHVTLFLPSEPAGGWWGEGGIMTPNFSSLAVGQEKRPPLQRWPAVLQTQSSHEGVFFGNLQKPLSSNCLTVAQRLHILHLPCSPFNIGTTSSTNICELFLSMKPLVCDNGSEE